MADPERAKRVEGAKSLLPHHFSSAFYQLQTMPDIRRNGLGAGNYFFALADQDALVGANAV